MRQREAAKLEKKRQLDEFRSATKARVAQEERCHLEKDKEVKKEKRRESQELEKMKQEEAAQLAEGDRRARRARLVSRGQFGFRRPLMSEIHEGGNHSARPIISYPFS